MAKTEEASGTKVEVIEDLGKEDTFPELKLSAKTSHSAPLEQLLDDQASRLAEKRWADPADEKLTVAQWIEKHLRKWAPGPMRLSVRQDQYIPIFHVEVNNVSGTIAASHIKGLRDRRDLDEIEKATKGFMKGFFAELRDQDL